MGNRTDSPAVDDPPPANVEDPSPSERTTHDNKEPDIPKRLLPREPGSSCKTVVPDTGKQEPLSPSEDAQLPQSSHDSAMDEASTDTVTALDKSKNEEESSSKKYHFNDEGKLVDEEGAPYKYSKAEYENVASSVTDMVYERLTSPPVSLKKISLTDRQPHWREEDSFVFLSDNLEEADKLVVIIHGSGQVRAGQWSRRLIINESLEIGSQIPYIRRCQAHGWAVLVTNTNDNFYVDEQGKKNKKAFSGTPIEHGVEAWKAFVFHQKNLRKIAIVAHSFGGHVTGEILCRMPDDDDRVVAVCLTDAFVDSDIVRKFDHHILACNWVGSSEPLDTESDESNRYLKVVSAGTKEHERTSHCCIDSVFRMIEEAFGSTVV